MKIVVIDDHPLVLRGIQQIISLEKDLELAGVATSCSQGVELIKKVKPDLVIVDISMPGESGFELIRRVKGFLPSCSIIVLTSSVSKKDLQAVMAENVNGYILKSALPEEFISAIRIVARGRRYYDPEILDDILRRENNGPFAELTAREKDIIQALARGLSNRAISREFCISENTVKKHISNLLNKLNLKDRTQAALYAFSHGLGTEAGLFKKQGKG
ncbi:MAG: response regulator transcription factor [Firmicutes bacterium]|nr:response regulator transcription factor [Bacillota bacterium]